MYLLLTRSAQHLRQSFSLPIIDYNCTIMPDGELVIHFDQSLVKNKDVMIVASTQSPAENIIELLFLLDALAPLAASVSIFFTYFGYARQPNSTRVIANILNTFRVKKIMILHTHDPESLQKYLDFIHVIDWNFFIHAAENVDIIVAPDKGAKTLAETLSRKTGKPYITLNKVRHANGVVVTSMPNEYDIKDKKIVIIDDVVVTGETVLNAAIAIKKAEGVVYSMAVSHAFLSLKVLSTLNKVFQKIYVTNSIAQTQPNRISFWSIEACMLKEL